MTKMLSKVIYADFKLYTQISLIINIQFEADNMNIIFFF